MRALGRGLAAALLLAVVWAPLPAVPAQEPLSPPSSSPLAPLAPPRPPVLEVVAPSPELARHVRQELRRAAPGLARLTGVRPGRIRVEVAPSREAFDRRARELGGPTWAAGLALPSRGLVLVRSPHQLTRPDDFRLVLVHELAHLYLARALRGRRAPLWLEEGLAMYASGEGGFALAGTMARGVLSGRLHPLAGLAERFPAQAREASLAYAQSYYLVSYLLNTYGPQVLPRLIRELSRGRELTVALHKVTGRSLAQVEEDFFAAMDSRFSWLALVFAGGTLWALVGVAAAVGLVWRRREHKKRLQAMEAVEAQETTLGGHRRNWPPPPVRGDVLGPAGLGKAGPGPGKKGSGEG